MRSLLGRFSTGRQLRPIAAAVSAIVVALTFIAPTGAFAAAPGGPASVTSTVDFVSATDLTTPITQLKAAEAQANGPARQFALRVGYGCGSAAACEGVTIKIDPQPLDEFYGTQRFATFVAATLPAGATRTGNDQNGYTISLGNLAAGATGTFTVVYDWQGRTGAPAPQSFFVDGTRITNSVTIDAANAAATSSASDSIVWHIDTKAPQVAFGTQGNARVDTPYDYALRMSSDCMWNASNGNYGEPAKLCAASYENTLHLPVGAQFVSATDGGLYDQNTRTITWSDAGEAAAPGWQSVNGFSLERRASVVFPATIFTDACSIDVTASFDSSVVYLDGATKTAQTSITHNATSCTPFAAAQPINKWSSSQLAPNIVYDGPQVNNWTVQVGNRANVPGIAKITDDLSALDHIRVDRVVATGGSIQYELDNGATGTAADIYTAPAGRKIVRVQVTSPELTGPNLTNNPPLKTTTWSFTMRYTIVGSAPADGWTIANSASAVMTYPGSGLDDLSEGTVTATVVAAPKPANFAVAIGIPGPNGNPVAGTPVGFRVLGTTSSMDADAPLEPQYVFAAPYQWDIVDGSWSLAAGAPAGATFERRTATIDGQLRQLLVVSWPEGTVWGVNASWPALSVQATPGTAAPAGSRGVATGFVGDASGTFRGLAATWGGNTSPQRFADAPDLDGDGDVAENFGYSNADPVTVGAAAALSTVKEICQADPDAADGCKWISDSSQSVQVSPLETGIRYRVTIRNNGNTALQNVVAYDVLPYMGDVGVSSGSASVPRGSQFAQSLSGVADASAALTLNYSATTNPCRDEVYADAPGCVDDWDASVDGKVAIRAALSAPLSAHDAVSFEYTASVLGAPAAGEKACNSIASAATGVPVSEPGPVCAEIVAADLAVTAGAVQNPQQGRPAVLPFTFSNAAGTASAGTGSISIPAGIRVTGLAGDGWSCDAPGSPPAPLDGAVQLECTFTAPLAPGDETLIGLPVVITASSAVIDATVDGPMYDPDSSNNDARITLAAAAAASGGLTVMKDDQKTALVRGQETTYAMGVTNELIGESVAGVTVTDVLPAGVEIISLADGGAFDSATRTIMWSIPQLTAAAQWRTSVTVRVADDAVGTTVTNTVGASAEDPAFPGTTLSGTASDVDQLDAIALNKTGGLVAPADPADPRPGDVVEYRFVVTNTGGGALTGVELTDGMAGLSAITYPGGWPTATGALGAGESVTGVARYTLTGADIDAGRVENTADVVARSAGGGQVTAESGFSVDLPALGGIALTKAVEFVDDAAVRHAGDEVEYTFEIANPGNVTLHDVAIADPLPGLSDIVYTWPTATAGVLPTSSSATATATYRLTQADVDRGMVENVATVSALDVFDSARSATADALLTIPAAPGVTLQKTGAVDSEQPVPGDGVDFAFTVINRGNVTLAGVEIEDSLPGLSALEYVDWPGEPGVLAPGETVTASARYAVSQSDIDEGSVKNSAVVTAVPVRGEGAQATAEVTVPLAQAPGLSIVKSASLVDSNGNGEANPGETIAFAFVVQNTGNVSIDDVRVVDPMVRGLQAIPSLAPGQSMRVTADSYTVTVANGVAGHVSNTATVVGQAPDGSEVVSDPSTTRTAAGLATSLAITGGINTVSLGMIALLIASAGALMVLRRRRRA